MDHVDILVIDVQGAELAVLNTLNWTIPIHVMLLEMNRQHNEIRELLSSHDFKSMLPQWDIRKFCMHKKECPANEVFVNTKWKDSFQF